MKLAAIDIGSNAVRLLIVNAFTYKGEFKTQRDLMVRVPLRLGDHVFQDGKILPNKAKKLVDTMKSFRHLMDVCNVDAYRAAATSAMRDAANGAELTDRVRQAADIDIELISGTMESDLIFQSIRPTIEKHPDRTFINIDVGGGSTEIVLFHGGKKADLRSFDIGTVRLLTDEVKPREWKKLNAWIDENLLGYNEITAFGTGGNIRKLKKLYFDGDRDHFTVPMLQRIHTHLASMTYRERMLDMELRYDRADVIVPAARIFRHVCARAKVKKLFVPKVAGLMVGLIRDLYAEHAAHSAVSK